MPHKLVTYTLGEPLNAASSKRSLGLENIFFYFILLLNHQRLQRVTWRLLQFLPCKQQRDLCSTALCMQEALENLTPIVKWSRGVAQRAASDPLQESLQATPWTRSLSQPVTNPVS